MNKSLGIGFSYNEMLRLPHTFKNMRKHQVGAIIRP